MCTYINQKKIWWTNCTQNKSSGALVLGIVAWHMFNEITIGGSE